MNMVYLKAIEGPMKGQHFFVKCNHDFSIGRSEKSNICISQDPYVSRAHAKIFIQKGEVIIEDLNSKNGTLLNGHQLSKKQKLKIGDIVQIGGTILKVIKIEDKRIGKEMNA